MHFESFKYETVKKSNIIVIHFFVAPTVALSAATLGLVQGNLTEGEGSVQLTSSLR